MIITRNNFKFSQNRPSYIYRQYAKYGSSSTSAIKVVIKLTNNNVNINVYVKGTIIVVSLGKIKQNWSSDKSRTS